MASRRSMSREHHRWVVHDIKATPAKLVGFVYAPDEQTAIKVVIKECRIPRKERGRLIAYRRQD